MSQDFTSISTFTNSKSQLAFSIKNQLGNWTSSQERCRQGLSCNGLYNANGFNFDFNLFLLVMLLMLLRMFAFGAFWF